MIMIDTDVIIWILRGQEGIKEQFAQLVIDTAGEVYVTPIQVAEIYAGMRASEESRTEKFFQAISKIVLDERMGKKAGEYMNAYHNSHNVTIADSLIAAATVLHHFKIWTLNKKHFPMISKSNFVQ